MVKHLPVMQETWVQSFDWEDSPGGGHGNPLQYFCQENPHGQRSLAGYSSWGLKEPDTAERLSTAHSTQSSPVIGLKGRMICFQANSRGGCFSVTQLHLTLCDLMDCSVPGLSVSQRSLPKFMSLATTLGCWLDLLSYWLLARGLP